MGYGESGSRPCPDEINTLEENVSIIDVASMVDNMLMCGCLEAVKTGANFIFLGDADKLVGGGGERA
jgi:ATP-dependent exoDNAse (exonuclease V) alpha subunit